MSTLYFSEREFGQKPRTEQEISSSVWGGIVAYINTLIESGCFGGKFPENCPDNDGVVGTNIGLMKLAVSAEFPGIELPLSADNLPPSLTILDFLEFSHEHVAKAIPSFFHSYWRMSHLDFDTEMGQSEFRQKINRIFSRNGVAFEIQENGHIARILPPVLGDYLPNALFQTGDPHLDLMLETARVKYLDPNLQVRLESLEKLWDAWERIKTLEFPGDKKKSVTMLLDKTSTEPNFRQRIEREANELTEIGNNFMIRHTETNKTPIVSGPHVDYLFHRMFALIYLVLGRKIGVKPKISKSSNDDLPF